MARTWFRPCLRSSLDHRPMEDYGWASIPVSTFLNAWAIVMVHELVYSMPWQHVFLSKQSRSLVWSATSTQFPAMLYSIWLGVSEWGCYGPIEKECSEPPRVVPWWSLGSLALVASILVPPWVILNRWRNGAKILKPWLWTAIRLLVDNFLAIGVGSRNQMIFRTGSFFFFLSAPIYISNIWYITNFRVY